MLSPALPLRPALAALLLAAALPVSAQPVPEADAAPAFPGIGGSTLLVGLGWTSLGFTGADGLRVVQQGVALQARYRHRRSQAVGVDFNLTWGLTDWDRAREWIDDGNQAGRWTTDRIQAVGDWAMEVEEQQGLRLMGAAVADLFLVATYAAVPACYLMSIGGATSHLQADVTATLHAVSGAVDVWGEAGAGILSLPAHREEWDLGVGLVGGMGADLGPVRLGARVTWSPPALHSTNRATGAVLITTATVSAAF